MASSSPSVVTVNRVGQVSTTSLSGTAVVLVTVHEEFGINQTVVVHVEVRSTEDSLCGTAFPNVCVFDRCSVDCRGKLIYKYCASLNEKH